MVRRQRLGLNLAFFNTDLTDFTIGLFDELSAFGCCCIEIFSSSVLDWIKKSQIEPYGYHQL